MAPKLAQETAESVKRGARLKQFATGGKWFISNMLAAAIQPSRRVLCGLMPAGENWSSE